MNKSRSHQLDNEKLSKKWHDIRQLTMGDIQRPYDCECLGLNQDAKSITHVSTSLTKGTISYSAVNIHLLHNKGKVSGSNLIEVSERMRLNLQRWGSYLDCSELLLPLGDALASGYGR